MVHARRAKERRTSCDCAANQERNKAGNQHPKAQSYEIYIVVGWGASRGEEALVYRIPQKTGTKKASEKRIPVSVFEAAERELAQTGTITRSWFAGRFPDLERDGSCNFTTLGGIFELLDEVAYEGPGVYRKIIKKHATAKQT